MSHEHLIAGILGGLTSTLVLHPLDLVKVRFAVNDGQSDLKKNYKGVPNAFKTIVREEGFRGLYKGVTPHCIGAGSAWGLYFLFYGSIKKHMIELNNQQPLGPLKHMFASASAGVITTTFTNPIWVVKTRLYLQYDATANLLTSRNLLKKSNTQQKSIQFSDKPTTKLPETKRYHGTWDAFKKIARYEGIRGLYRGFVPGLLSVSHGAIQLTAYEELKKLYLSHYNLPSDYNMGAPQYLTCATMSKLLAACITYPYQVVRARLQDQYVQYNGLIDVVKRTWRNETYRGFYKGFNAYLLHVTPNVCIVFLVYETTTKAFK